MQPRHGWLFPVMVLTALCVMVFGVLGISAITGRVPLVPAASDASTPAPMSNEAVAPGKVPRVAQAAVPAEAAQPAQGVKRMAHREETEAAARPGTLPN